MQSRNEVVIIMYMLSCKGQAVYGTWTISKIRKSGGMLDHEFPRRLPGISMGLDKNCVSHSSGAASVAYHPLFLFAFAFPSMFPSLLYLLPAPRLFSPIVSLHNQSSDVHYHLNIIHIKTSPQATGNATTGAGERPYALGQLPTCDQRRKRPCIPNGHRAYASHFTGARSCD